MVRSLILAALLAVATTSVALAGGMRHPPGSSIPQMSIGKVEPSSAAPGERITITGLQFMRGARVWLGGTEAPDVQVDTAERLTLTVPRHEPGRASVMIRNPDGREVSRGWTFTYQ